MNKKKYTHSDGQPLQYRGQHAIKFMSDSEAHERALKDPDAQPLTKKQLAKFKRTVSSAKRG